MAPEHEVSNNVTGRAYTRVGSTAFSWVHANWNNAGHRLLDSGRGGRRVHDEGHDPAAGRRDIARSLGDALYM
jgi:hypothetical protein